MQTNDIITILMSFFALIAGPALFILPPMRRFTVRNRFFISFFFGVLTVFLVLIQSFTMLQFNPEKMLFTAMVFFLLPAVIEKFYTFFTPNIHHIIVIFVLGMLVLYNFISGVGFVHPIEGNEISQAMFFVKQFIFGTFVWIIIRNSYARQFSFFGLILAGLGMFFGILFGISPMQLPVNLQYWGLIEAGAAGLTMHLALHDRRSRKHKT